MIAPVRLRFPSFLPSCPRLPSNPKRDEEKNNRATTIPTKKRPHPAKPNINRMASRNQDSHPISKWILCCRVRHLQNPLNVADCRNGNRVQFSTDKDNSCQGVSESKYPSANNTFVFVTTIKPESIRLNTIISEDAATVESQKPRRYAG